MTKRDLAELACRILALVILILSVFQIIVVPVQVLMAIWSLVRDQAGESYGFTLLASSLSAVLHLAFVSFLWTRSRWIATKLVSEETPAGMIQVRAADMQVAAFSTIGMIFLLNSIWYLSRALGRYVDVSRGDGLSVIGANGRKFTWGDWLLWEPTLEALVTGAIAVWLVLGSRSIVGWLRRLRKVGIRENRAGEATSDVA